MSRATTIAGITASIAAANAPRAGMEALMFAMAEANAKRKGGATQAVFDVHQRAEEALKRHGAAVGAILLAVLEGVPVTAAQEQALIDADEALDAIEAEHKAAHEALQAEGQPGNDAFDSIETSENEAVALDPLKLH